MDKPDTGALASAGIETHRQTGQPVRQFAVLGERSSGTNLVARLLRRHTALHESRQLGWKHGFVQAMGIAPDLVVVASVRNAPDWLISMHAKPWHSSAAMQRLEFSAFIRAPWDSILDRERYFAGLHDNAIGQALQQDRHPISGRMFANLLEMRALKAAALLGLRHRGCHLCLVQMEHVQRDPARFLADFSRDFGLAPPAPYQPITRRLGARFKPAVEPRPATPDKLSGADLAFVRDNLDAPLEADLGYGDTLR